MNMQVKIHEYTYVIAHSTTRMHIPTNLQTTYTLHNSCYAQCIINREHAY